MNEITKPNYGEMMALGKTFFESGMFTDIKSIAQAVVKIAAGAELGIPPFAALTGVHVIQGKPTLGANLIAGKIKASGKYNYRVVQQDDKACIIDFFENGEKMGTSAFTIEDAKKAQTKNLDKFPRNMLFARAISNGARWYCPDVFSTTVYVHGEIPDNDTVDAQADITTVPKSKLTDKGFEKLLGKLAAEGADIDAIVRDTMAKCDLTDAQAEAFAAKVAELQTPPGA